MNIQDKTKEELINELRVLQQENDSLKALKVKRADELVIADKELLYQNQEKVKRAAELYLAKEIAEEFEEKFRQIAENIEDVFWLKTNSEMMYMSPSFEKIWGVCAEDFYKNPEIFTEKVHPDDRLAVLEIIQSNEFKDNKMYI